MLVIKNLDNIEGQKVGIGPERRDWRFLKPTIWHDTYQFMLTDDNSVMYIHIHRNKPALEYNNQLYSIEHRHMRTKEAFAMFVSAVVNNKMTLFKII